jgi:hypothetical protein
MIPSVLNVMPCNHTLTCMTSFGFPFATVCSMPANPETPQSRICSNMLCVSVCADAELFHKRRVLR